MGQSYYVDVVASNTEQSCATDSVQFNVSTSLDVSVNSSDISILPGALFTGTLATIHAAVRNSGVVPVACQVSFYVDGLPGGGGVHVGTIENFQIPSQGQQTATMGWSTTGFLGHHTVYVVITNIVPNAGDNTSNNIASLEVYVAPLPDLQVTALTPPPAAQPGTTVEVSWTESNLGDTQASGSWQTRLYFSTDPILDLPPDGDTEVGAFSYSGPLEAGGSVSRLESFTLPVPPSGSNFWIIVKVDAGGQIQELNENNNTRGASVCASCLNPDLIVGGITVPPLVESEQLMAVEWTVINQGSGQALGSWADRILLRPAAGGTDVQIAQFNQIGPIAGNGASYTRNENILVPYLPGGDYFIIVRTDILNTVSEPGNESNNEGVSQSSTQLVPSPRPNLVVTQIGGTPNTGSFGSALSITWSVQNQGNSAALSPWQDQVFLSTDQEYQSGVDTPLPPALFGNIPLAVGEVYDRATLVTLPVSYTASGQYYLLVRTNSSGTLAESNIADNVMASQLIQLSATPFPDLKVTSILPPPVAYDRLQFLQDTTAITISSS
ncbi:MAG: hypothetical protein IPK83_17085 [Planctomycetes bacterium]|nr:hypothetical protein [Planctomycetota bacterium]